MIFTDQIDHQIRLEKKPKRIISLVPSQTELLFDLGLDEEVIGITKFCIHPKKWHQSKNRIGGTKNVNFEKIRTLQPDLIIANKEENQKDQIEELQKIYPVWTSDIRTLEDNFIMINEVGGLTGKGNRAFEIVQEIKQSFLTIPTNNLIDKPVLYLIWKNPYMTVGRDTFIDNMLLKCGLKNVIKELRYPVITEMEIKERNPNFILLSSEPYPFKEKDIDELKKICPKSIVILVDGELFSWYGSRLKYSPKYFVDLINKIS